MKTKGYKEAQAAHDAGLPRASIASTLIQQIQTRYGRSEESEDRHEVAMNVLGIAYAAGSDTTSAAVESFLVAMAMFPGVQKKAQDELDRVVGPGRLPEYEDLTNLPYLSAVTLEVMRWIPVTPIGVPHAVIADDNYNGYYIPKGSAVIANQWGMLHNPVDYPEPELFRPERFLGSDGKINRTVRDPTTIAFGFGRRICAGRYFSNNALSICIASTLHTFNIQAGLDSSGKPVKLTSEMFGGLIAKPKEVPCGLTPRSDSAARLVRDGVLPYRRQI
ncbi:hypothetical protein EIP91_010732 [Steccherinum ochraceum]|uniref:Cytochrome P450 n=1 Tax=Steccherinum ochraceum TaxID=92696 RepID=A0A4R0RLK6_9APHY|nr:hypothetical protein EIP91_010732 [Steccherinum ochraceum]